MIGSDSVGLLFRIKTDGSQSKKELQEIKEQADKLGKADGSFFSDLANLNFGTLQAEIGGVSTSLTGMAGVAGVAIGSMVSLSVAMGSALFGLAKNASETGSILKDFQDKTGLSAKVISTLKFNLEQSGLELKEFQKPLTSVTKLLYEASQGNDAANNTLKKFGLTAQDTTDNALQKILAKIYETKNETEKLGFAMEVGGAKGAAAFRAMSENVQGDLNAAIDSAKAFGVVLSEEEVNAADAFGDSLSRVSTQASVLAAKFALQYAPQITKALDWVSDFLARNQNVAVHWGTVVGDIMTGIVKSAERDSKKTADSWSSAFSQMSRDATIEFGKIVNEWNPVYLLLKKFKDKGEAERTKYDNVPVYDGGKGVKPTRPIQQQELESQKAEAEKRQKEREAIAKADNMAQIALRKNQLDRLIEDYQNAFKKLADIFKETKDAKAFETAFGSLGGSVVKEINAILPELVKFQNKQAELDKKTALEKKVLGQEQRDYQDKLQNYLTKAAEDANKLLKDNDKKLTDEQKKQADERIKITESEFSRKRQIATAETQTLISELQAKLANQNLDILPNFVAVAKEFGDISKAWNDFVAVRGDLVTADLLVDARAYKEKLALIDSEIEDLKKLGKSYGKDSENYKENQNKIAILNEQRKQLSLDTSKKIIEGIDAEIKKIKELADIQNPLVPPDKERKNSLPKGITPDWSFAIPSLSAMSEQIAGLDPQINAVAGSMNFLKDVAMNAFGSMIGGAQDLLTQWILTGQGSGKAFLQMTAQLLSGLVVQAGVKAIFEVAEGYAALATTWGIPNPSSIAHFAAAGIYGTIAGAAAAGAVGLRLAIGNSMNSQQRSVSSGVANSVRSSSSTSTTNDGRTIVEGRQQRQELTRVLEMRVPQGWMERAVIDDINSNGTLRNAIVRIVETT